MDQVHHLIPASVMLQIHDCRVEVTLATNDNL